MTSVNDAPFTTSLEDIAVPTNSSIIFDLENYLGDFDNHSSELVITFLPDGNDEIGTLGSSFYGGSITQGDGFNTFEFEYTPSTSNTPVEDFILYKPLMIS